MINLRLSPDELLLLLGCKEAQLYQQAKDIDAANNMVLNLQNQLAIEQQKNSELMKDRDMDQIELTDLKSKVARITMLADRAIN